MNVRQDQFPRPGDSCFDFQMSAGEVPGTFRLSGELDFSDAEELYDMVRALRREGLLDVVLDVSGLTFLSAAGLDAFARAAADCDADGGSLTLTGATRGVARVMGLTGLGHLISPAPTSTPALAESQG